MVQYVLFVYVGTQTFTCFVIKVHHTTTLTKLILRLVGWTFITEQVPLLQWSPMIYFAMKDLEEQIQYISFRNSQIGLVFIIKGKMSIKIYLVFVFINIFFNKSRKKKSCEIPSICCVIDTCRNEWLW